MSAPRLAAFPKCFLDALLPPGSMSWPEWTAMAAQLPHIEGIEMWPPALLSFDPSYLRGLRRAAEDCGLTIPMVCASPDFTQPDPTVRAAEIERHGSVIYAASLLGSGTCRVLSGQRRPEVSRQEGVAWTIDAIETLLPVAERLGVTLVMENHYKDSLWHYPEFAQSSEIFLEILNAIDSPWLGVNYDPSNALIAGEEPEKVLEQVKHRIVSMHASDRSVVGGTLESLRRMDADPLLGYAPYIEHGVIGRGSIDYDAIFDILAGIGFGGWISIEDGQDPTQGMEDLAASAEFLAEKIRQYWPTASAANAASA